MIGSLNDPAVAVVVNAAKATKVNIDFMKSPNLC